MGLGRAVEGTFGVGLAAGLKKVLRSWLSFMSLECRNTSITHCRHEKGYFQVTVKGEQANLHRVECLRLSTSVTLKARSRAERFQAHHQKHTSLSPEPLPPSDQSTPKPLPLSKVSYTVRIPSEQEPQYILLGWTAPDFTFSPADVASVMADVAPYSGEQPEETCLDQSVRVESGGASRVVYSACVMVPLVHLLEEASVSMLTEVTCAVDCDKREVEYTVDGKVIRTLPLQVCAVWYGCVVCCGVWYVCVRVCVCACVVWYVLYVCTSSVDSLTACTAAADGREAVPHCPHLSLPGQGTPPVLCCQRSSGDWHGGSKMAAVLALLIVELYFCEF